MAAVESPRLSKELNISALELTEAALSRVYVAMRETGGGGEVKQRDRAERDASHETDRAVAPRERRPGG